MNADINHLRRDRLLVSAVQLLGLFPGHAQAVPAGRGVDVQINSFIGIKKRGVPPGLTIEEARPFITDEWPPDLPDAPIIGSLQEEVML
jgi:hypothetical protein